MPIRLPAVAWVAWVAWICSGCCHGGREPAMTLKIKSFGVGLEKVLVDESAVMLISE
jgi:hypothetical protein